MGNISNLAYIVLVSTLRMSVPLILAATGGAFSIRCGVSDLGCEGMMIAGAFFGMLGSYITGNPWLGLVSAMLFGAVFSMIHAVMHVTYRVNATISGMCVNLLGTAITPLLLQVIWGIRGKSVQVAAFSALNLEWMKKIPVIGRMMAAQNIIFYLTIVLVVLGWMFLFKTTAGLRMRMVSENPQAASTVGINVTGYKYFGVMMSGVFCGLGGAYLSLGQMNMFIDGMTSGRGYIAVVINAFGRFNPLGALAGSIFFGFFDSLQTVFQGSVIPTQWMMMLPYILTLAVISVGLRKSRSPAGVGKHHN